MDFKLRGKVLLRIDNKKKISKAGKPYSWDYLVLEYTGVNSWGKEAVFQFPIKIWNSNKAAPFRGDIEVGDVIEVSVSLECQAWNGDVKTKSFIGQDGIPTESPSLFMDLILMDVTSHVKGKVAENLDFGTTLPELDEIKPEPEDDLPF